MTIAGHDAVTERQSIASMTLISGALSFAALAAAVAAIAQLARQSVRLREELDQLQNEKVAAPAGAGARPDARPMFGGLYDSKPSPLEKLGEWPGVPLAIAAAGLFSVGLFTNRPLPAAGNQADSTIAQDMAAARQRYDSLAKEVDALQDSMALLRKPAVTARPAAARKIAARSTTQPAVAPLPSLPRVE